MLASTQLKAVSQRKAMSAVARPVTVQSISSVRVVKDVRAPVCSRQAKLAESFAMYAQPRTSTTESKTVIPEGEEEFLELDLNKPLGLKFKRGNDGGAYVVANDPNVGNTDPRVMPGDKIVQISASFGEEVWEAQNFGQIMYAIKTRSGSVYLKMKRNFGDMSGLTDDDLDETQLAMRKERNGGNYGAGTKEIQTRNYIDAKESERKRRELFDDALGKFKVKDFNGAIIDFENIIATEPRNFVGDNGARSTQLYRVSQYNMACCYSMMGEVEEAVKSIEQSLAAGFDGYEQMRKDKNLTQARTSPKFEATIQKYDEPVVNWGAIKATFNVFNVFGKKKEEE